MTHHFIYELSSLVFLAIAMSMDAFSISLSYGLQKPRLKRIFQMGVLIGFFHMLLPFTGIILGHVISGKIGYFTSVISGLLLTGVGLHMFFSAFSSHMKKSIHHTQLTLVSLAFIVSIDSFSVGLSLGMTNVKILMTLILFGLISMIVTWAGLLLGRKINHYIGVYSEILGGSILVSFGLHILFT